MTTHEPPKPDIDSIVRIMQGLLASGHYTEREGRSPFENGNGPQLRLVDRGKEWKEDGYKTRRVPHVVLDAVALWENLHRCIWESEEMDRDNAAEEAAEAGEDPK